MGHWLCHAGRHHSSDHSTEQVALPGAYRWIQRRIVSLSMCCVLGYRNGNHWKATCIGEGEREREREREKERERVCVVY